MKRRHLDEDFVPILRLPHDVLNKIQFITIGGFLNLGITCKYLYHFQAPYKILKENEIHTQCIERIRQHLCKIDILKMVEKIILQFEAFIDGRFVKSYLLSAAENTYPLMLYIPMHFNLKDVYDYIQENFHSEDNFVALDYSTLSVNQNLKPHKNKITIVRYGYAGMIKDFNNRLRHTETRATTDLNKVYYDCFWKLLATEII